MRTTGDCSSIGTLSPMWKIHVNFFDGCYMIISCQTEKDWPKQMKQFLKRQALFLLNLFFFYNFNFKSINNKICLFVFTLVCTSIRSIFLFLIGIKLLRFAQDLKWKLKCILWTLCSRWVSQLHCKVHIQFGKQFHGNANEMNGLDSRLNLFKCLLFSLREMRFFKQQNKNLTEHSLKSSLF